MLNDREYITACQGTTGGQGVRLVRKGGYEGAEETSGGDEYALNVVKLYFI